jgi:hypothetical protein
MAENHPVTKTEKLLSFLFIILSLFAFGVSIFMVFFSQSVELGKHAIFWFIASVLSLTIPVITPRIQNLTIKLQQGEVLFNFTRQLEELKEQIKDSIKLKSVFEYLASDAKVDENQRKEIKAAVKDASPFVREAISSVAASIRNRIVYEIINSETGSKNIEIHRMKLDKFIPVFEALIEAEKADKKPGKKPDLHAYQAQLAYIYKDQYKEPDKKKEDYRKAYEYIDAAISNRDDLHLENLTYTIYELNRLILGIELGKPVSGLNHDFDTVWKDNSTRFMLFQTSDNIALQLNGWVAKKIEEKQEILPEANGIVLGENRT